VVSAPRDGSADEVIRVGAGDRLPLRLLVGVDEQAMIPDLITYVATVGAEGRAIVRVVEHTFPSGLAIETVGEAKNLVQEAAFMLQMAGIGAERIVRHGRLEQIGMVLLEEATNWNVDAIVLRARSAIGWQRLFGRGVREQVLKRLRMTTVLVSCQIPRVRRRLPNENPSAWPTPVGGDVGSWRVGEGVVLVRRDRSPQDVSRRVEWTN
jgi:nucleotide-binding universal stress UspA family protein